MFALVIDQRSDATPLGASNEDITDAQCAALNQDGRNGTPAFFHFGFDDRATCSSFGGRLKLKQFRLQLDCFLQFFHAVAGQRGDMGTLNITTQVFDLDLMRQQFGLNFIRIDTRLVALVDGDNDRDIGRFGVSNCFNGLWHQAVVGGDHENDDIGDIGAPSPHFSKCCMTRSIEEADSLSATVCNLIGPDMLCDAAGFT